MTAEILAEAATQLPAAGALLALSVYFGKGMGKFVASANQQREVAEARHSATMRAMMDDFLAQIITTSGECHSAQDRASVSISELATATHEGALELKGLSSKVETVIQIARQSSP